MLDIHRSSAFCKLDCLAVYKHGVPQARTESLVFIHCVRAFVAESFVPVSIKTDELLPSFPPTIVPSVKYIYLIYLAIYYLNRCLKIAQMF